MSHESQLLENLDQLMAEVRSFQSFRRQPLPLEPGALRRACLPMAYAALRVRGALREYGVNVVMPTTPIQITAGPDELESFCNLQVCESVWKQGNTFATTLRPAANAA